MADEENCVEFTCECGYVTRKFSNLNRHRMSCNTIIMKTIKTMYEDQMKQKDTQIAQLNIEINRVTAELCSVKEKLAAETARNQAQLNGFVSMAIHQHQQPVYTPPPPTQIYVPPPPPIAAATPPPPPQIQAEEPNITIEIVSAKPATEEKIPRPKQYLDLLTPIDINDFTDVFKKDEDYNEETQEGYRYFIDNDFKTTYEGGSYDCDRHEYWLLDIFERVINGYGKPLTYRPFHSMKHTQTGNMVMAFYENDDWVFDNDQFESKFITCLRNMRNVINIRINDIEVPQLALRNEDNIKWNVKKNKESDEILVETSWESEYTKSLRIIATAIQDTITNPYKIMVETKKKFILDTDTIRKDMDDPTQKLKVDLEKKKH